MGASRVSSLHPPTSQLAAHRRLITCNLCGQIFWTGTNIVKHLKTNHKLYSTRPPPLLDGRTSSTNKPKIISNKNVPKLCLKAPSMGHHSWLITCNLHGKYCKTHKSFQFCLNLRGTCHQSSGGVTIKCISPVVFTLCNL